jgi:hypothetical protein
MSWGLTLPMIGAPEACPDVTDASSLLDVVRRLGPEA